MMCVHDWKGGFFLPFSKNAIFFNDFLALFWEELIELMTFCIFDISYVKWIAISDLIFCKCTKNFNIKTFKRRRRRIKFHTFTVSEHEMVVCLMRKKIREIALLWLNKTWSTLYSLWIMHQNVLNNGNFASHIHKFAKNSIKRHLKKIHSCSQNGRGWFAE